MPEETKPKNPWLKRFIIYLALSLLPYIILSLYLVFTFPKEGRNVWCDPRGGMTCAIQYVCEAFRVWFSLIATLMVIASIISYIISRRSKKFRILALEFSFSMLLGFLFGFVVSSSIVQPILKPILVSLGFSC